MNINTITALHRPAAVEEVGEWRSGHAWLAGGTWLFSEPQLTTDTLIDLEGLGWRPITVSQDGVEIAATCRIADLYRCQLPSEWTAGPLFHECCESLLASFKVWNAATVGGNICMSLPAGAMISLTVALEGVYTLWPRDGEPRTVSAVDFVTGNHANILRPGELLRSINLPATALRKRFALRRASLTQLGRSAALVIATEDKQSFRLTITAATPRPVQLSFVGRPSAAELLGELDTRLPDGAWFDDANGSAAYKRHVTRYFAGELLAELAGSGDAA